MKKSIKNIVLILVIVLIVIAIYILLPKRTYKGEDFNITTIYSPNDKNENGIDDYTDILIGARNDAKARVHYKSAYYSGGYPPENEGVCTDLIWRALKQAGYSLKDLIDEDIALYPDDYPGLDNVADPNIDFRRVSNLKVFFDKYAKQLTTNPKEIKEWNPGDIVIFGPKYSHIGIISDKRNKQGIPYLIHNAGQWNREENTLLTWYQKKGIVGHYRWEEKHV